jgi:hypothetical protein
MRLGGLHTRLLTRWGATGVATATTLGLLATPALASTTLAATLATTPTAASATTPAVATGPVQTVLYQQPFTGADTPPGDWISKNTGGKYQPCLTAADKPTAGGLPECLEITSGAAKADPAGSGAFEVTNNNTGESGFGLFTRPLETSKGIQVDFDLYQFNAHTYKDSLGTRGGDGVAFFLINGAASPAAAGDAGGSLGYRNLPGALIGLGFDEFGNFSDPRWGGTGGPGERPNTVVLRGADATGYQYISGVKAPAALAVDSATQRGPAKRHVMITLSTKNMLSVYVNFYTGKGPQRVIGPINLNTIKGQPALPPTIKFGFAAATGAATAYHEIQGMTVASLPPDLRVAVSHSGAFQPGGAGVYQLTVNDDAGAGPTTGTASVTFHVPDGLTAQAPSGDGWQCSVSGQVVTCTRSDMLAAGAAYPPVRIPVAVAGSASGTVTATAAVSDPNDTGTTGKSATDSVTLGVLSPDITITSSHSGGFVAGGTGTYTFNVSDKANAGPTTGPVTVTFPVPAGLTATSASGSGWTCTISGQAVSCTRSDVLQPGASYPPLTAGVSVGQSLTGVIPSSVSAATTADANPQSVTATDQVTITPPPPDLSMAVTTSGPFNAGGTGTYSLTTSNAAAAGPTTGTVTATFTAPPAMTVQSATGDGWTCSISGQVVTCTRPGSDADALAPGSSYPAVQVKVAIPASASGQLPASATTGTAGDSGQPQETGSTTVTVTPLAPDLGVTITANPATAGTPATITLVATDSPDAGPVTGMSTVSLPVPAGYKVTSVTGDGWSCSTAVVCTRSGGLAPGDSFPPVTVTFALPATASGQVPLTATAQTANQPAAGTGTGSLQIQAAAPKLHVSLGDQGTFTAGKGGGQYLIGVSDDPSAGPVTKPVTVTFPLPAGMTATSASGKGWTCTLHARSVTCNRSDALAPGAQYPVITVATSAASSLSGAVPASVTASTPGGATATATDTVTIGRLAPSVSVAVTPPSDGLTAGDTGMYTVVASDSPKAGPTTGPTTVTFTVPDGVMVASADGDGWQCTVSDQAVSDQAVSDQAGTVTCTRSGTLKPGESFPPVEIGVSVPDTATDPVTTTAAVDTPGNGAGAGATATTQTPVTALPPDPTVSIVCEGNEGNEGNVADVADVTEGGIARICVSVGNNGNSGNSGNNGDAGAVTNPVTVSVPAPAGMTPESADGRGWNCGDRDSFSGFVCVHVGDMLNPGQQYPVIDTSWKVNGGVTGTVAVHATCYTAGQRHLSGAQASSSVTEEPPAPDVTTHVTGSGPVRAGGREYMTVDVADAATAGPAGSGVSVTVPMPPQLHPASVYGNGWDCTTYSSDVSCHRPGGGKLPAGSALPPITICDRASSAWAGGQVWARVGNS